MGAPKATLDWHGTPLAHRVAGILARMCAPVIVVGAAGQSLPLPPGVETAVDTAPERGPLEGIAAGVRVLAGRAPAAFLAGTDLPLLHPAFVTALLAALPGYDAAVVAVGGHDQLLAAAYETGLLERAPALLAEGRPRVAALLDGARVRRLGIRDVAEPESVRNANTPQEYRELHGRPQPAVIVSAAGGPPIHVEASTLGAAAAHVGWRSGTRPIATVNGLLVPADPATPLVAGDIVELRAGPG